MLALVGCLRCILAQSVRAYEEVISEAVGAYLIEPGRPLRCLTADHTTAGDSDALDRLAAARPTEPYRPTEPDSSLIDAIGVPHGV